MDYSKHFNPRQTPQSEPMPGREAEQARNNAGGYAFTVDHWTDLERFLVLGTQDGTYYVGEAELTRENCQSVLDCIKEDGVQVVAKVLDISLAGRAPKQDPALFVLALCLTLGNQDTKMAAQTVVPRVARTGTPAECSDAPSRTGTSLYLKTSSLYSW
jgi:60 kDa SS-A/Ro ribonucleoprotein